MSDDLAILDFIAERKRPRKELQLEVVRELTLEDLEELRTPGPAAVVPINLDRIREIHHVQARLLAEGRKLSAVAAIVGTSVARLKQLELDPTFQELVSYYRDQVTIKYLDVHEKLALGLGMAVEELVRRLEEAPEEFSNNQLRLLVETLGDRSIAPSKVGVSAGAAGGTVFTINFAKPEGVDAPVIEGALVEPGPAE